MKHRSTERNYKDPVCGMELSRITAIDAMEYKDKTYYFCTRECRETFETDPEKYIHHHRQHGVKPRQS